MNQGTSLVGKDLGLGNALKFVEHESGLVQGVVSTPRVQGSFFLLGGHVAEFQPAGQEPVLFLSERAVFEEGKAIRGGIPVCLPWFGPKKNEAGEVDANAPSHGLVRTELWQVGSATLEDDVVSVSLEYQLEGLQLKNLVRFGTELSMSLSLLNESEQPAEIELALHTYFKVGDVASVKIQGLEQIGFLDQLSGQTWPATGEAIEFSEETDRIYHGDASRVVLVDPEKARRIKVDSQGSRSTVVWNPWIEKSKRMADFGDHEYPEMCCIETANIRPNQVRLGPGEGTEVSLKISVAPI